MSCKPSSYSTNLGDGSKWENPNFNTFGTNGVFAFKIPTKLRNYNVQIDKDKLVSTCFVFQYFSFIKIGIGILIITLSLIEIMFVKLLENIFEIF